MINYICTDIYPKLVFAAIKELLANAVVVDFNYDVVFLIFKVLFVVCFICLLTLFMLYLVLLPHHIASSSPRPSRHVQFIVASSPPRFFVCRDGSGLV